MYNTPNPKFNISNHVYNITYPVYKISDPVCNIPDPDKNTQTIQTDGQRWHLDQVICGYKLGNIYY